MSTPVKKTVEAAALPPWTMHFHAPNSFANPRGGARVMESSIVAPDADIEWGDAVVRLVFRGERVVIPYSSIRIAYSATGETGTMKPGGVNNGGESLR